jgi:outer membrane lipoprotein carrier protein
MDVRPAPQPAPHSSTMRINLRLALAGLVTASATMLSAQAPDSAAEVAAALQRKYDSIRDFSADFTHQHQSSVLRRKVHEQGSVLIKKPGKMRWEYQTPEKKLFVSDGKRIYFYEQAINQVTITEMPDGDQAASAVLFLTGKGNLSRDFTAGFLPPEGASPSDSYGLRLDPKVPQGEYDWLEIVVDRRTLLIQRLTAADKQGGRSTFLFSRFKENIGVGDKPFAFEIPRGAEVIHAGRTKF